MSFLGDNFDKLMAGYIAKEERKMAEALSKTAPAAQARELQQPTYTNNVQADPSKTTASASGTSSGNLTIAGVQIDQRVLIGTVVVIAGIAAFKFLR